MWGRGILFSSKFITRDLRKPFHRQLVPPFYSPLIGASVIGDLHFQGFGFLGIQYRHF